MMTLRRPTLRLTVTRHFVFTRLQDQLVVRAYEVIIPVAARPLERLPSQRDDGVSVGMALGDLRSKAGGA